MSDTDDFAKFMHKNESSNGQFPDEEQIAVKSTKIFDIKRHPDGLLFDLRIFSGDKVKVIKNLFIPNKFYSLQIERAKEEVVRINNLRKKVLVYGVIYPAAVLSIMLIIHGLVRIWPIIHNLFKI